MTWKGEVIRDDFSTILKLSETVEENKHASGEDKNQSEMKAQWSKERVKSCGEQYGRTREGSHVSTGFT